MQDLYVHICAHAHTHTHTKKMNSTSQGLHVRYSHSKDGQLVRLAGQCAACRHHITELVDVGCHLVAAPTLYFTVALPGRQQGILTYARYTKRYQKHSPCWTYTMHKSYKYTSQSFTHIKLETCHLELKQYIIFNKTSTSLTDRQK